MNDGLRRLNEFLAECIHYNVNILRDRRIVYVKEWFDAGILCIRHLYNGNGDLMNFQEFQLNYPNVRRTNFLMYEGILKAIKVYKEKQSIRFSNTYKIQENKLWFLIAKGNKKIQAVLSKSEAVPTAISRWNEKYNDNFNWEKIFQHCIMTTADVQLRWFQMRILHRLLPTEKYLHTCKIAGSPLCNFCNAEQQTIEHLLWKCTFIKPFWDSLLNLLKQKCTHTNNLDFNETLIIFGVNNQTVTDSGLNKIILWAKFFIYKSKMQKVVPQFEAFITILKNRIMMEKYLAKVRGRENSFTKTWNPYRSLTDP